MYFSSEIALGHWLMAKTILSLRKNQLKMKTNNA